MTTSSPQLPAARRNPVWLAFAALAAAALWQSLGFGLGSFANVGPGLFPLVLSAVILVISLLAFALPEREVADPMATRPMIALSAGVLAFILLIDAAGMLPAVVATMVISYLGQTEQRYLQFLLYAFMMAAGCWLLFVHLLNVPVGLIGPR